MSRMVAVAAAVVFLGLGTAQAVESTKNIYCASKDCWGQLNVGQDTQQTINGYCGVESDYKDGSIMCSTPNAFVKCKNTHPYQCTCNTSQQNATYELKWAVACD